MIPPIDSIETTYLCPCQVGGLKGALTTTTKNVVSLLGAATSAKGLGAVIVSGPVSGKQSAAYINIKKVL